MRLMNYRTRLSGVVLVAAALASVTSANLIQSSPPPRPAAAARRDGEAPDPQARGPGRDPRAHSPGHAPADQHHPACRSRHPGPGRFGAHRGGRPGR